MRKVQIELMGGGEGEGVVCIKKHAQAQKRFWGSHVYRMTTQDAVCHGSSICMSPMPLTAADTETSSQTLLHTTAATVAAT